MHGEADYARLWVALYEDIVQHGRITRMSGYPVLVNARHVMAPSPIPKWDVPRLNQARFLSLFGAGREKRVYAIPPHTDVVPLTFDDYPFTVEDFAGLSCVRCGSTESYLTATPDEQGGRRYACSDTDWCDSQLEAHAEAPA